MAWTLLSYRPESTLCLLPSTAAADDGEEQNKPLFSAPSQLGHDMSLGISRSIYLIFQSSLKQMKNNKKLLNECCREVS
jgi:hypothetical protein